MNGDFVNNYGSERARNHSLHCLFRLNTQSHTAFTHGRRNARTHTCFHNPQAALYKHPPTNPPVHSRNSAGLSFTSSPTALSLSHTLFSLLFLSPAVLFQFPSPHEHPLEHPSHFPRPPHFTLSLYFLSLSVWNSRLFLMLG